MAQASSRFRCAKAIYCFLKSRSCCRHLWPLIAISAPLWRERMTFGTCQAPADDEPSREQDAALILGRDGAWTCLQPLERSSTGNRGTIGNAYLAIGSGSRSSSTESMRSAATARAECLVCCRGQWQRRGDCAQLPRKPSQGRKPLTQWPATSCALPALPKG